MEIHKKGGKGETFMNEGGLEVFVSKSSWYDGILRARQRTN